MKKLLLVLSVVAMASFLLVGCLGTTPAADKVVTIAAIPGVTAPVTGATPVTTITATAQYTGVVTWSKAVTTPFAAATVYTAEITLTPATGFTLIGVTVDFFTVAGATAANLADSGVVTAVFPATAVTPAGPTIAAIPDAIVEWDDEPWTYQVVASLGTGTTLTYSLIGNPVSMSISTTGLITWTTILDMLALHEVTVKVLDNDGLFATETFIIEVIAPVPVPPLPVPPEIVSLLPLGATVGEAYVGQVTAEPGDAAIASYALTDPPAGMTIVAATGVVNWVPTADGSFDVTVVVTDGAGLSDTEDFTIEVAARIAPVIVAIDDQTILWGEDFEYQVTLTAAGTDLTPDYALAATRVANAIGLAIDDETGLITWTPLEIQNGLYEVTVTATDTYDSSLFDTEVFTILVEDPAPPEPLSATIVYAPTHSYNDGITQYVRGGHGDDCVGVTVTLSEAVEEDVEIRWNDGSGYPGSWEPLEGDITNTIFTGELCFGYFEDDCEIICVEVRLYSVDPCCPVIDEIIFTDIVEVDSERPCAVLNFIVEDCGECEFGASISWDTSCEDYCGEPVGCCGDFCSGVGEWTFILNPSEDICAPGECDSTGSEGCPINGNFECGCLLYADTGEVVHIIDISIKDNVGNELTDTVYLLFNTEQLIDIDSENGWFDYYYYSAEDKESRFYVGYGCSYEDFWEDCDPCWYYWIVEETE